MDRVGQMRRRLLAVAGAVSILLALPGAAAGEELRFCTIDRVEGDSARAWNAGVWSAAVAGLVLTTDAKVSTGADSRVRIACNNRTVVTVGTRTEQNLESLVGIGDLSKPVVIQLLEGIVGLVMPTRYREGFEARTPVGVASVRGTEWLIEWHDGDSAAVFVRNGEVKTWGAARIATSTERLGFDGR